MSVRAFFAFLSHFRFWKGICKVASWIGLEILVPKHLWKNKIGPLQPILAAKRYVSFFWVKPVVILDQTNKRFTTLQDLKLGWHYYAYASQIFIQLLEFVIPSGVPATPSPKSPLGFGVMVLMSVLLLRCVGVSMCLVYDWVPKAWSQKSRRPGGKH